jgi:TPR repeat protein
MESMVMKAITRLLAMLVLITVCAAKGGEIEDLLAKANEGDAGAQYTIGLKYTKGDGVSKDMDEAVKWLQKSAEQGNADAQLSLGALNIGGRGLPRNSEEAAKWFQLAAGQGRVEAQVQIARMHIAGTGVAKNDIEAYKWAKLAWTKHDRQANRILVFLRPRMTAVQIAEGDRLATEFLAKKAADNAAQGIPNVAPPLE